MKNHLNDFDPTVDENSKSNLSLKALTELLFMCSLYNRRFGAAHHPVDEFLTFCIETVKKMPYVDNIHRKPELVIPYSTIYMSAQDCGFELPELRNAIQAMLDSNLPQAVEDNPYRKMELRYALERTNFKHNLPSIEELFKTTCLYESLPLLFLKLEHVYVLTHLIFYLTDFGFSQKKDPPNLASLRYMTSTLLGEYDLEKNWDISAELLMCCKFLDIYPAHTYQKAWSNLISSQKADGALTDTFFDAKKHEGMIGSTKEKYYFEEHYHTTMVSAACAFLTDDKKIHRTNPHENIVKSIANPKITQSLQLANSWLHTYHHEAKTLDLHSAINILIGQWTYSSTRSFEHSYSPATFQRITNDIAKIISENPSTVNECDPALLLLGLGVLRKLNIRLEALEAFAKKSFEAINQTQDLKNDTRLRLFPVLHLLNGLGFNTDNTQTQEEQYQATLINQSEASEENLTALINYVSRSTSFGLHPIQENDSQFTNDINSRLAALAFYYLNHYKLDEALMLIRAMNHQKMNSTQSFQQVFTYILNQQREDGSYGFYSDEIKQIAKSDPKFDSVKRITLPLTVSAMWTIAEANTCSFSLFNSIRTQ